MTWHIATATDFMRRNLVTLGPEEKVLDGVARLLKHSITGAPVTDDEGKYLGVFSEKCCMNALTDTVELAVRIGIPVPKVRDFMTTSLITLAPNEDVFVAIDHILAKRISGVPVLDEQGTFLGIFSEKTAMRVLISAAYDHQPSANIDAYINTDLQRVIGDADSLIEIAKKFLQTPYRRLPVLRDHKLVGQVSRRDVIRAELHVAKQVASDLQQAGSDVRSLSCNCSEGIESFVDTKAKSITAAEDILSIAQIFLNTPYRRLAVVESARKLIGQVSRCDLLSAAAALLRPRKRRESKPLYLSPLTDRVPAAIG